MWWKDVESDGELSEEELSDEELSDDEEGGAPDDTVYRPKKVKPK